MPKYVIDESTMVGIADNVRRITGSTEAFTPPQMIEKLEEHDSGAGYDSGYADGQQAEQDRFWDAYIKSANGYFANAFSNYGWTDETYNPNQTIICTSSAKEMYNNAKITSSKVNIELRCALSNSMFATCTNLKTIPYLGFFGVTNATGMFSGCANLENITIDGEIGVAIGFAGSPKLTDESIQSIIDHLADLTGQTSLAVGFHSTVLANLTEEQINAIGAKNWTF